MSGSRTPAVVALLVLGLLLAVLTVMTTPWQPLSTPSGTARAAADYRRDFAASEIAREVAYRSRVRPPAYGALIASLVVAALLGLTTVGSRIVDALARPLGGGWWTKAVVGGIAISLIGRIVTLPLSVWSERVQRRFGLSTQTWGTWAVDQVKSAGVHAVILTLSLTMFYGLARAAPRTWWAWGAAAAAAFVFSLSFLYPVVLEPVFNKFTSMPAGPLRDSLLQLAKADGVPVRDVLVADASRRTTALNAYVSGFGGTRRIVVYDTLVETAPPQEVRLVVAHELGHAKRQDVLVGTALGALAAAASMPLLWLALGAAGLVRRAGADNAADPRGVALLLFLVTVVATLSGPVSTLVSRRIEARADVHSLDLTRDPQTFAATERRLAITNLSDLDPPPLIYGLFYTHPTVPERIALARTWARAHGLPEPGDLRPVAAR